MYLRALRSSFQQLNILWVAKHADKKPIAELLLCGSPRSHPILTYSLGTHVLSRVTLDAALRHVKDCMGQTALDKTRAMDNPADI